MVGAFAGFIGGAVGELVAGIFGEGVLLREIGIESLLWGVSLSLGAGAAYWPSHWISRGLAGGATYGLARGVLTAVFSLSSTEWAVVLGSEIVGGMLGGLLLAYLWRPTSEGGAWDSS